MMAACNGSDSTSQQSGIYDKFESQAKKPAANIYHEDGWTIIALKESGDRIYWFLAPEVDNVTPALFKKTVYAADENGLKTAYLSECEARKRVCDDLMNKFRTLSEKYD
mgnify:CR=1 FL=1